MNNDKLQHVIARHEDRFVISDQDKLEELMKFIPSTTDKIVAKNAVDRFRTENKRILSLRGYVNGVLKKMVYCKKQFESERPIFQHIEFLHMLGYTEAEIMLTLFEFGYRQMNSVQVNTYLRLASTKARMKRLKDEYKQEMDILKANAFQQMAGVVLDEEKKYLQILIKKLPDLYDELENCDPDKEIARWNRLNKTISETLEKCKAMHGIDLYREFTVKTAGAIAVQQAAGTKKEDDFRPLPQPTRREELAENGVIEMEPIRMVIKQEEHEL